MECNSERHNSKQAEVPILYFYWMYLMRLGRTEDHFDFCLIPYSAGDMSEGIGNEGYC